MSRKSFAKKGLSLLLITIMVLSIASPGLAINSNKPLKEYTGINTNNLDSSLLPKQQKDEITKLKIKNKNQKEQQNSILPDSEQLSAVNALKNLSKKELKLTWNSMAGVPEVITGAIAVEGENNTDRAFKFLNKYQKLFKMRDFNKELKLNRIRKDNNGMEYVRIDQYYK